MFSEVCVGQQIYILITETNKKKILNLIKKLAVLSVLGP